MKKFYKTESGFAFDEIDVDMDSPHNDGRQAVACIEYLVNVDHPDE